MASEDNDVIAELIPTTPMALQVVRHAPAHLRPPVDDPIARGYMENGSDKIQLRFSSPRKYAAAFLFGRSSVCDVQLDIPGRECHANTIQWAISVAPDGHLSIVDVNYDGQGNCKTVVMYDKQYATPRSNFIWRLNGVPGPNRWSIKVTALSAYAITKDSPLDSSIGFRVKISPKLFTTESRALAAGAFAAEDAWMPQIHNNPADSVYVRLGSLGKGSSGSVSHLWNVSTGEQVAKKEFWSASFCTIQREIRALQSLRHENVLKMMFYAEEHTEKPYRKLHILPVLYLEYAPFGSLRDADMDDPFTYQERMDVVRQCMYALVYLHDNNIMHRDIKPENILVFSRNPVLAKIADFGIAKYQDETSTTVCGTYFYMAPEIAPDSQYTLKVDVWALGMTFLAMTHGELHLRRQQLDRIRYGTMTSRPYKSLARCQFTEYVSLYMLVKDPEQRLSMRECAETLFPNGGDLAYPCCPSTSTMLDDDSVTSIKTQTAYGTDTSSHSEEYQVKHLDLCDDPEECACWYEMTISTFQEDTWFRRYF